MIEFRTRRAPTSVDLDQATDLDVVVDESVLGYTFLVSAWNFGIVLIDQLEEFLGSLAERDLGTVKSIYRFVVTGDGEAALGRTGVGIGGPEDERLTWRAEQLALHRPLWRPWRRELAAQEGQTAIGEPSGGSEPTFAAIVKNVLEAEEWDLVSLAETAHVPTNHLETLLADQLDLTDQSDVDSVAAVLQALRLDLDAERPCGQARDILALIARGRYGKIGEQAERTLRMPSAKTLPESVNPT